MNTTKTYILENDPWYWSGLEDFCKSFDPNFVRINTSCRDYMPIQDFMLVGMLVQPNVERLIVASAFEMTMYIREKYRDEPVGYEYFQFEHFANLIEYAHKVRERLGYGGFTVEINYHGIDFITDIKKNKWGKDCSQQIQRFVRQNPDNLTINVYKDYVFQYRLTEENIY